MNTLTAPDSLARRTARVVITLLVVAAACWAALRLWDHYELSPWTRDGRVKANVVQIAPDVSGLVTAVPIHDNEPVKAGALLFEVDKARYELAQRQAQAALTSQRTVLAQALREDARNAGLGTLVSMEAREQTRTPLEVALSAAQLNLQRAGVRAPVDGLITNLDLREGGYANAGHAALALVDTRS